VRFVANSVVTSRRWLKPPETVNVFWPSARGVAGCAGPSTPGQAIKVCWRPTERRLKPCPQAASCDPRADAAIAGVEFGKIDAAAWKQTEEIMRAQKLIPVPVDAEALFVAPEMR